MVEPMKPKPYLGHIDELINKGLEKIHVDAEWENEGEGSMRYAFIAWIEQTLRKEIPEWLLEIAEV